MKAICLIDTSVFVEILGIPTMNDHPEVLDQLKDKISQEEKLFLPMATIIETGNHIAQKGDRSHALDFVERVQLAISGTDYFAPVESFSIERLQQCIADFPNNAVRGVSLGDLSIIQDWQRQCDKNQGRTVYIWSLDTHLKGYCREATV